MNISVIRYLNNSAVFYVEQFKYLNNMELYSLLRSVTVSNWFCGEVSLLYAWSNGCTIESKLEQNKVRRILSKHGYKAHFGSSILNIEIINKK